MTEDGTQWGTFSKDREILGPLYKMMVSSHLDPRTAHSHIWCLLNTHFDLGQFFTFMFPEISPYFLIFLFTRHNRKKGQLQHMCGNELFLLFPKILTSALSSQ